MSENKFPIIMLCLSIFVLVGSIVLAFLAKYLSKRHLRESTLNKEAEDDCNKKTTENTSEAVNEISNDSNKDGKKSNTDKEKSFLKDLVELCDTLNILSPFQLFALGFFLAAMLVFIPIVIQVQMTQESGFVHVIRSIFLAAHSSFRMFSLDQDYDVISELAFSDQNWSNFYYLYTASLFAIGPFLTAGAILSLFSEALAYVKYRFAAGIHTLYVFSELNERSMALAEDVVRQQFETKDRRRIMIVFCDVYERSEESISELTQKAKDIGAICLKRDVTQLWLSEHFVKNRKLYFIGNDQSENIQQGLFFIKLCSNDNVPRLNNDKTELYIFSTTPESEVLINSADIGKLKVRRVNESRNLAFNLLSRESTESTEKNTPKHIDIFENAIEKTDSTGQQYKELNIMIVGMGLYGTELMKAICWLSQMPGYRLNLHIFDKQPDLADKLTAAMPDLFKYCNDIEHPYMPQYDIVIHSMDINSTLFAKTVSELRDITLAIITTGNDDTNIETAMNVSALFGRTNIASPGTTNADIKIYTVVYDKTKTSILNKNLSFQGDNFKNIQFIGDVETVYSIKNIEMKSLEDDGLKIHLGYSVNTSKENETKAKSDFNHYEYNRSSSISRAIYLKHFQHLLPNGVIGSDGNPNPEEAKRYEHNRWILYMRTCGFIFVKENVTNKLYKVHKELIPIPYKDSKSNKLLDALTFDTYEKKISEIQKNEKHEANEANPPFEGTIRFAEKKDVPVILRFIIELAEYENMSDQVIATEKLLKEWLFDKKSAEVIFVLNKEKQPVGFALFFHNFSTFLGRAGIFLEDLYVSPEYRRQGYGKALLHALAQIAVERECGRLEWNCLNWNQPSIDFYLGMGAQRLDLWNTYRLTGDALLSAASADDINIQK